MGQHKPPDILSTNYVHRWLRAAVFPLVMCLFCCAGCFGPFRVTGGPDDGSAKRWPGELEAARAVVLRSADDQAKGTDPPAVGASVAVRQAFDQLERASIIWRDETLPNRYNNGADLQRNEQNRINWRDDQRAKLEREAVRRISDQRAAVKATP
jgi:hypothetical protein